MREQYKAVYRLHTVVAGHCISDVRKKWENSEWRRELAQELSLGAHLHGMIPSVRSKNAALRSSDTNKEDIPLSAAWKV